MRSRVLSAAGSCLAVLLVLAASGEAMAQPAPPPPPPPPAPAPGPWTGESPARAADPEVMPTAPPPGPTAPPPPPPLLPLSTSGTEIDRVEHGPPQAIIVADHAAEERSERRLQALEARVAYDEQRERELEARFRWLRYFKVGAYVQPQLLIQSFDAAASPNATNGALPAGIVANDVVARADGTTTNGNYFRLRRTRLKTAFEHEHVRLQLEIDPLPVVGTSIVRDAVAGFFVGNGEDKVQLQTDAGLFMVPISLETLERSENRPFIERSFAMQSIFPGQRDIGVRTRLLAAHGRFMAELGVVNGQSIGEPHFSAQPDLNKGKDVYAHVKYDMRYVTVGVAGYIGSGQNIDATNLRLKQYTKWLVNYEVAAHARLVRRLGETKISAELMLTRNMDSGVIYPFAVPAIPPRFGDDVADLDGRALYVRVEQEIGQHLLLGYRFDTYTPNTDVGTDARDTHAAILVLRAHRNLRWMNEVDFVTDNVHALGAPPPSKHGFVYSSVIQASF